MLNSTNAGADEQRFLEASMAYVSGKPIMSDEEYDKLKVRLKVSNWVCSIELKLIPLILYVSCYVFIYNLLTVHLLSRVKGVRL